MSSEVLTAVDRIQSQKALLLPQSAEPDQWVKVQVPPPPVECCTRGWNSRTCTNTLQEAIDKSQGPTVLQLEPGGIYCNEGWSVDHSTVESKMRHQIARIQDSTQGLVIRGGADNSAKKPKLLFDGSGGIQIRSSKHVYLDNLEIEGPSLHITGVEASANHDHITDQENVCGVYRISSACKANSLCQWSGGVCGGKRYNYYNGQGVEAVDSQDLKVSNLHIHHCPASGFKCQRCDWSTVKNSLVYGNTWWSTSATSGLTFAESQGRGKINVLNNAVYANRNFMPFFTTALPEGGGSGSPRYGTKDQDYIHDGQGIYSTRNQDYQGTLTIQGNLVFDNGINGISVHKTTGEGVDVRVVNNLVVANGQTSPRIEKRQNAGGIAINSGGNDIEAKHTFQGNHVHVGSGDISYQCYGKCTLVGGSAQNTYCGGPPQNLAQDGAFSRAGECGESTYEHIIRDKFPDARMPACPQWEHFDARAC